MMLALVLTFFVGQAHSAPRSTEQKAVDAFLHLQTAGLHHEILNQTQALGQAGFTEHGSTKAVMLTGGCGFAGCAYLYLVTTPFHSAGPNPQTKSIAAIVRSSTWQEKAEVKKVLTNEELKGLLSY